MVGSLGRLRQKQWKQMEKGIQIKFRDYKIRQILPDIAIGFSCHRWFMANGFSAVSRCLWSGFKTFKPHNFIFWKTWYPSHVFHCRKLWVTCFFHCLKLWADYYFLKLQNLIWGVGQCSYTIHYLMKPSTLGSLNENIH